MERARTRSRGMSVSPSAVVERLREASAEVILGSGSATRRAVLTRMGIDHVVEKPDIDERAIRFDDPAVLVEALARAKARAVVERVRDDAREGRRLLITCDQVVVHLSLIHI